MYVYVCICMFMLMWVPMCVNVEARGEGGDSFILVSLTQFVSQLDITRVSWEEGHSTEELSPSDCPVGVSV